MNLFDQLINTLLSAESIIEEAKRNSEDVTGRDEKSGLETEYKFAAVLKSRFGAGRMFKSPNQSPGVYQKAQQDLKNGVIAWYSGSEKQDKIDHIDFMANIIPKPNEEDIDELAKSEFAKILELESGFVTSPEFDEYWDDSAFASERESAYRMTLSEVESKMEFDINGFEVKSYKGDTKYMHGKGGAVLVELVGGSGMPGWLMGKADFIAYRENSKLAVPPNSRTDISDGFIIVNRKQLLDYVRRTVSKDSETDRKEDAWYTPYRRKSLDGRPKLDLVAHIDLLDAKKSGVYMEFWQD